MDPSTSAAAHLTPQVLQAAIDEVYQRGYSVCVWPSNQHVVSPSEAERGGLARCAACGRIIDIDALRAAAAAHPHRHGDGTGASGISP